MTALYTAREVAKQLGCSEWLVLELAKSKTVQHVRLSSTGGERALVRFTDEQVAELIEHFTVKDSTSTPTRRRKRRSA